MHSARNQFFASSGFSLNQHSSVAGSDRFDLFQDFLEWQTLANDFIEVQHGTSFAEDDIERLDDDYGRDDLTR